MTDYLIDLLKRNRVAEYGVDVLAVVTELKNQGKDPVKEFRELFYDSTLEATRWHSYALEGLRGLAARGHLTEKQAIELLVMTDILAWAYRSMEEYYKSISALANSTETAPVLVQFVQQKLGEQKDLAQWRWLAFFAAGSLLQTRKAQIPCTVVAQLLEEASNEQEPRRKQYFQEVATSAREALGLP